MHMLVTMVSSARIPVRPIKSLLYWRKSKLNGAATVPVVLSLDPAGVIRMQDSEMVTMFAAPASQATVRFTNWGTMMLTIHGRQYDVVGVGATLSPQPSSAQLAAVDGGLQNNSSVTRAGSAGAALSAVEAIGAVAGAAGGAAMQFAYYKGLEAIKVWQDTLPQAGALVQKSPMNAMKYFTLALVAVVVIGLVVFLSTK